MGDGETIGYGSELVRDGLSLSFELRVASATIAMTGTNGIPQNSTAVSSGLRTF